MASLWDALFKSREQRMKGYQAKAKKAAPAPAKKKPARKVFKTYPTQRKRQLDDQIRRAGG